MCLLISGLKSFMFLVTTVIFRTISTLNFPHGTEGSSKITLVSNE